MGAVAGQLSSRPTTDDTLFISILRLFWRTFVVKHCALNIVRWTHCGYVANGTFLSLRIDISVVKLPVLFTCAHAASRYCIWQCLSVCLSRKILIRNRCNLVGICFVVNAINDWKLEIFDRDLKSYFRIFYLPCICYLLLSFECLNIATSFLA